MPDDLTALEEMLVESGAGTQEEIAGTREESHGLGLFVRSLPDWTGRRRRRLRSCLSDTSFSAT